MLEEEVEALQVGFEKGFWAKPFSGMEIFDRDSPFCEEYFFQKYPPEFILIFSSSLWRFSEALVDFCLDLLHRYFVLFLLLGRTFFSFLSSFYPPFYIS